MAEFVQIGDSAFNPNLLTEVEFRGDHVALYFTDKPPTIFYGESYEAFKVWWERKADVDKVL